MQMTLLFVARKQPGGGAESGCSSPEREGGRDGRTEGAACGGGGVGWGAETESSLSAARSDNSKRIRPGTSPLSVGAASVHRPLRKAAAPLPPAAPL